MTTKVQRNNVVLGGTMQRFTDHQTRAQRYQDDIFRRMTVAEKIRVTTALFKLAQGVRKGDNDAGTGLRKNPRRGRSRA